VSPVRRHLKMACKKYCVCLKVHGAIAQWPPNTPLAIVAVSGVRFTITPFYRLDCVQIVLKQTLMIFLSNITVPNHVFHTRISWCELISCICHCNDNNTNNNINNIQICLTRDDKRRRAINESYCSPLLSCDEHRLR